MSEETNEVTVTDDKGNEIYDWNEDPEIEDDETDGGENEEEQSAEGEGKEDLAKAGEEETGKDTENKEGDKDGGTESESKEEEGVTSADELRELRSLLRDQKREISILQAKLGRTDTRATKALKATIDEDDEGEEGKEEELSTVENLSQQLGLIGRTRGPILEVLAETMEQNPKYSDLREVCSRANFDDVFDAVASQMSREGKGSEDELRLQIEIDVWNMSNPYKYMYEYIKKYHPAYIKADKEKEETSSKEVTKKQPPKEGMKSLAGTDGSVISKDSGWSAARIDALPEDELDKVPADVYERYLSGELK